MPEIEPTDKSLKSLKGLHLWHAPLSSCSQRVRITLVECGQDYESHVVNLERDEHATPEYQRIHPKGLVPALVDNGRLFIESVDIIQHIAGAVSPLSQIANKKCLDMADAAQLDLKLLTFEFLFRAAPPPSPEIAKAFQDSHQNEWLRQFRNDFANGFSSDRVNAAIARTDADFVWLDRLLSDGREFLEGPEFSLSDIAWMPNVHRFGLMDWPFEYVPYLSAWFERMSRRPSYQKALLDWQSAQVFENFATYTKRRQMDGTDVCSFPHFQTAEKARI
jgi:glutathione S-transferase|tara:strand:+ start:144 stop:974 length:831 start_codon:yes stop_codon:yes gene_type:complete